MVPQGSHICWVVDDDPAFVDRAAGFLAEGERLGEKAVVFAPEASAVLAQLRTTAALAADPFVEVLERGPLDPARMFAMFREQVAIAKSEGYRGLRVVADMDWLLPAHASGDALIGFETLLDAVVMDLHATVLCAYRRGSFDDNAIGGQLCVHPTALGCEDEPPFRLVAEDAGSWRLSGEVDMSSAPTFAAAFAATTGAGGVVDVRNLAFIDVAGLRAIAEAGRSVDARVQLHRARPALRRYWQLSGFDEFSPNVELVA